MGRLNQDEGLLHPRMLLYLATAHFYFKLSRRAGLRVDGRCAGLRIDWAAGCLGPGALVAMKGHGVARGQRGTGAVAQWLRGVQVAPLASM